MSITLDHVETIKNMTADALFDNFDDFCQMSEVLPGPRSPRKIQNECPELNVNLNDTFKKLVYDKTNLTTPTKDSTKHTQSDGKVLYNNKRCFSDLFTNTVDDSVHVKTIDSLDYYINV